MEELTQHATEIKAEGQEALQKTKQILREGTKDVQDTLPEHAQGIYREACNSAWEAYADLEDRRGNNSQETTAHKVAWAAVKQSHKKNSDGEWVKNE
jgi:cation transport regulator